MPHDQQLPPHDRPAERCLLAALLRDPTAIHEAAATIKPEHFYVNAHALIYQAILALQETGMSADLVSVASKIAAMGKSDDAPHAYIAEVSECWSGRAWTQYADLVRAAAVRRALIRSASETMEAAYDLGTPVEEIASQAEQRVLELSQSAVKADAITVHEAMRDFWKRMDARRGGEDTGGVLTGWVDLDTILSGFRPADLVLIAARPSVGKSAMGLQIAKHAAIEQGVPTLFCALEQSSAELCERLVVNEARVDSHRVRTGRLTPQDTEDLIAAGGRISEAKLWIDSEPSQSILRISANARRFRHKHKIGLLVVDYIQLIDSDMPRAPRHDQVGSFSRRLKILAKQLDIPVVAMAQVNRGSEDRANRKPRLSDLRESGSLEQDADTVILLHRPEVGEPGTHEGLCEVQVAKQRNGPTGEINLMYMKQFMRFENWAMDTTGNMP